MVITGMDYEARNKTCRADESEYAESGGYGAYDIAAPVSEAVERCRHPSDFLFKQ